LDASAEAMKAHEEDLEKMRDEGAPAADEDHFPLALGCFL
jgi:hypothetical protein